MGQAYQLRDAGAVIHSHSVNAVLATMLTEGASEFHITQLEMIKVYPRFPSAAPPAPLYRHSKVLYTNMADLATCCCLGSLGVLAVACFQRNTIERLISWIFVQVSGSSFI